MKVEYFEKEKIRKKSEHLKVRNLNGIREFVINHRHNVTFFLFTRIFSRNFDFTVYSLSMTFFYYSMIF